MYIWAWLDGFLSDRLAGPCLACNGNRTDLVKRVFIARSRGGEVRWCVIQWGGGG